jgi:zinc ribbon protein
MAMIPCPECNQPVSDLAPSCPNCGVLLAPRPEPSLAAPKAPAKKTGCWTIGCAVLAGLFLIVFIAGLVMQNGRGKGASGGSPTTSSSSSSSTGTATPEPAAPTSRWSYVQNEDAMAKGTVSEASVKSSNTVNFSFPYAGDQHGTLTLRTHPRYGKDVIFSLEKGQIPCPSYSGGCKVLVRFDDAAAIQYTGVAPADNSTETVFIRDYSGFVARMSKAKTVRISANIYQEGAPVFEFDVRGFDQARYKPKP